jgi:hypothetical protein
VGHTLSEGDIAAVRNLLVRRDMQIGFLYEREKEFSEVLNSILRSNSFRLYRALTWPLRKCRDWMKLRRRQLD